MFHPDLPGLYFVGLIQPLGAIMPIAERQSELIADAIQDTYALPPAATMWRSIRHERKAMAKRYVASKRHTIQVDYDDYMRALRREREEGAARTGVRAPARASRGTSLMRRARGIGTIAADPSPSLSTRSPLDDDQQSGPGAGHPSVGVHR
jgi:hypothetical protein